MTGQQCSEDDYYIHDCDPTDKRYPPNITCPREIRCPAESWTFEDIEYFRGFNKIAYYWIDGVALCPISIIGLLLNITGIVILARHQSMRNFFNHLLMSLFLFDSTYILATLMNQSLMVQFKIMPRYGHFSFLSKIRMIIKYDCLN